MKNKKQRKLGLILIVLLIILGVIVWYYPSEPNQFVINQTFERYSDPFFDYEITKYPSNVEITLPQSKERLSIGFVTDPWNINFGIIPVGSYGTRHLMITNSEKNKVRVNFKVYGTVKPLISFNKNNFILLSNESAYVDVFLNTTEKTQPGNYTGEIDVVIKKLKFDFLHRIL